MVDDIALQDHMQQSHSADCAVDFAGMPAKYRRPWADRHDRMAWVNYHDRLHRTKQQDHQHEETADMTLIEMIWEKLEQRLDTLLHEEANQDVAGEARGLALALAILLHSPNEPDVDRIREEAMRRHEEKCDECQEED